jgi:hypothetical protein
MSKLVCGMIGKLMTQEEKPSFELNGWQHGAIFLFACLLIISRRPDAISCAQFFYEDGRIFFADAYNLGGWHALFHTYAGYFHAVPRIGAALATLVPMIWAPLVTNIIAIMVQAVPVNLLLSTRSSAWGGLGFRALMTAAYIALPDNAEITFGITMTQWLLALSAILLILASVPRGWVGRSFDCAFLLLAGLSGPFCLFVLPIAVFLASKEKETRWRWVQCAVLGFCSMTQLWALLILDTQGRPKFPIGFSASLFARMLGGDIFAGALLGRAQLAMVQGTGAFIFLLCVAVGGVTITSACFMKSHLEMKLFLVFSCMVLAASLLSPTVHPPPGSTMWGLLVKVSAMRYWFMPSLAFAWSLLWCVREGTSIPRSAAAFLLCLMVLGIAVNWENPTFKDLHFAEYARTLSGAPPGTAVIIPENPPGWSMRLVKHASR